LKKKAGEKRLECCATTTCSTGSWQYINCEVRLQGSNVKLDLVYGCVRVSVCVRLFVCSYHLYTNGHHIHHPYDVV